MHETITITMLGAKGSGKTAYMHGMYAVMREGVSGFTFNARDDTPDEDLDLEMSAAWEKLVEGSGEDRWPLASTEPREYAFDFRHGLASIMKFEWLDYRGDALIEASSTDLTALKAQLSVSSGIFLCVSGEHLAPAFTAASLRKGAAIPRMLKILGQLHDETGVIPPVAIVITKFDMCRTLPKEQITTAIREVFHPLFQPEAECLLMICPVSLGTELDGNTATGAIDPKHVHLPVAFAVYNAIRNNRLSLTKDISDKRGQIASYGGNWLKEWWNNSEIEMTERERVQLEKKREQIERHLKLLRTELVRGVTFYYGGEEVDLDD